MPKSRQTVPETHSEHDATTTGGRLEKQPLRKQVQAPFASVAHSDDAAHCWHVLSGAQRPLAQSPATRHLCPSAHGPQDPPQSMPVSLPFCRPSVHVGAGRRLRLCLRFLCFWCPAMAWTAPGRPSPPASAMSAWRRERRWVRWRVRASNAQSSTAILSSEVQRRNTGSMRSARRCYKGSHCQGARLDS